MVVAAVASAPDRQFELLKLFIHESQVRGELSAIKKAVLIVISLKEAHMLDGPKLIDCLRSTLQASLPTSQHVRLLA